MSLLKKSLAALTGLISSSALASVDIKHPEFVLALGGDWVQVASQDAEQFSFESKRLKSTIVISIAGGMNVPQKRLVEVAGKFLEFRLDAER